MADITKESMFIGTTTPAGVIGTISRNVVGNVIEAVQVDDTAKIGYPVELDGTTGKAKLVTGTATAGSVYGFLVRKYSARLNQKDQSIEPVYTQAVLRNGFILVQLAEEETTPIVKGMPVWVVIKTSGKYKTIGTVAAKDDSSSAIQINATFMGPVDKNGVAEIAYNI